MKNILPSKSDFLGRAKQGKIFPLYAELDLPSLTPLAAFEAVGSPRPAVLLESARVNEKTGRYSFVAAEPYLIFKSRGDNLELELSATPTGRFGRRASMKRKPLQKLRELLSNYRTETSAGLPPFTGGAVGVSPEQPHRSTARPATNAAFGIWKRRMEVTSSLGTLRLDAPGGPAEEEDHVESGHLGDDGLSSERVAVPRHISGLSDLRPACLLVDAAVEREELIERRAVDIVQLDVNRAGGITEALINAKAAAGNPVGDLKPPTSATQTGCRRGRPRCRGPARPRACCRRGT